MDETENNKSNYNKQDSQQQGKMITRSVVTSRSQRFVQKIKPQRIIFIV